MTSSSFRLRAFENSFAVPLLTWFEERSGAGGFDIAETIRQILDDPWSYVGESSENSNFHSSVIVRVFMLVECAEWVRIGIRAGDFSEAIVPRPLIVAGIDMRDLVQILTDRYTSSDYPFGANSIVNDINAVIEEYSEDRLEYLRIILFSNEREWRYKLGQISSIVADFRSNPNVEFSTPVVDQITWFLYGTSSSLRPRAGAPSAWRSDVWMRRTRNRVSVVHRSDELDELKKRFTAMEEVLSFGDEVFTESQRRDIRTHWDLGQEKIDTISINKTWIGPSFW